MKATVEMEIKVSGGRIIKAQTWTDGTCKLLVEVNPESEKKPKDISSKTPAEVSKPEQGQGCYGRGPGYEDIDDFYEYDHTGCP